MSSSVTRSTAASRICGLGRTTTAWPLMSRPYRSSVFRSPTTTTPRYTPAGVSSSTSQLNSTVSDSPGSNSTVASLPGYIELSMPGTPPSSRCGPTVATPAESVRVSSSVLVTSTV